MQEREKILRDGGALPKEEGDLIREYKAMHEENFLSSWLREDLVGNEERGKKEDKKISDEVRKKEKKKRGGEKRRRERRKRDGDG